MSHASHPLSWHCSWVIMLASKFNFCIWNYLYFCRVLYQILTEVLISSAISVFQLPFSHKTLQHFTAGTWHHLMDRAFHKISGNPLPKNLPEVNSLGIIDNILAGINTGLKDRKGSRHKYLTLASGGRSPCYFLGTKCLKQDEALNNNCRCWFYGWNNKRENQQNSLFVCCSSHRVSSLSIFSFKAAVQYIWW